MSATMKEYFFEKLDIEHPGEPGILIYRHVITNAENQDLFRVDFILDGKKTTREKLTDTDA